jgi:hypothetical protein
MTENHHSNDEIKMNGFQYSGLNLIDEVNELYPELVIDVGCGSNFFKGKINNLIGFDKSYHENLDFHCNIQNMKVEDNSVDIVLALGSLQYYDRTTAYDDLSTIVRWVKSGGYIVVRVNQLVSESVSAISGMPYRWSKEWIDKISLEFKIDIVKGPVVECNNKLSKRNNIRTVWWWKKQ